MRAGQGNDICGQSVFTNYAARLTSTPTNNGKRSLTAKAPWWRSSRGFWGYLRSAVNADEWANGGEGGTVWRTPATTLIYQHFRTGLGVSL